MKLHRFIGNFDLNKKIVEIQNPENIKQIRGVLRLEIGENLILSNGNGKQVEVKIESMSKEKIVCTVVGELSSTDPDKKVSLYLAILKKENFELAVQKAVECGVNEIIPIITERTVKTGLNISRLEKIILEATEQCGRSLVPKISEIMDFESALQDGKKSSEKIVFHLVDQEYNPIKNTKTASIFIGPEGGFSEKEITKARENEYTISSLGLLTLRAETATIIATYRTVQGL